MQELYHEMHALDRFEQDCRRKAQEEDNSNAAHRGIYDTLTITCYIFETPDAMYVPNKNYV